MKILYKGGDGEWMEHLQPTAEQLQEMATATQERIDEIEDSLMPPASAEDAFSAQSLLDSNAIPGSILLSCVVWLPSKAGLINCRVKGAHKQVKF